MRVTNWGLFLLGVYLVLAGLTSLGLYSLSQITTLLGVVAGVLLVMDNSRR